MTQLTHHVTATHVTHNLTIYDYCPPPAHLLY